MKGKMNFITVAISLFVILALAGGIAFIVYFTNNFSTELTTFYVQYGAQEIRRDTGKMQFDKGVYYTFKVNYPLGFPSSEKGDRYKVSVEITEAGKEIECKVDSRLTTLYPKPPDITGSFEIEKSDNSFTFRIPEEITFESILRKAYEGKTVTDIPQVDFTVKDYFYLTVKSYDEKNVIKIGFGFESGKSATQPNRTPSSPSSQIPPSSEGSAKKYDIWYDTLGSGSMLSVKFDCVPEAAAGEVVSFKATLIDLSEEFDDYYPIEITNIVLREEVDDIWLGQGEGTFSFIMPAHDVTIMFYLMPKEG